MTTAQSVQRSRAAQAGFVMKAYRESFARNDGRRGLTQEELLRRMAEVDPNYEERFSHATVPRWESGSTRPSAERLRAFGKALDLSEAEVAGLILMSGLAPDFSAAEEQAAGASDDLAVRYTAAADGAANTIDGQSAASGAIWRRSSLVNQVCRFLVFRTLPLAVAIVIVGYAMSMLGWDAAWLPVAYVAIAVALVLGQGFLFPDADSGLREFFWITLFFLLTTPLLQFAPLRMDHYNFHLIGNIVDTPLPYMYALLCNLAAASLAGLIFHLLWIWQNSGARADRSAHIRAAWSVVPPVGLVYLAVLVFSNASVWIQLAVLMPIVAAVFTVLLVIRDPTIKPSANDRRFILATVVIVMVVFTALGMAVVMAIYLLPHLPTVLPDHNLVRSWDLNFERLGYSRQEALELVNLGYLWHAICLFAYMLFVVGGNFIVAIYRMGGGSDTQAEASSLPAATSTANAEYTGNHAWRSSPLPE